MELPRTAVKSDPKDETCDLITDLFHFMAPFPHPFQFLSYSRRYNSKPLTNYLYSRNPFKIFLH